MPWIPGMLSAPALEQLEENRQHRLVRVPYFEG
jgi:hypothetical protein